MYEANKTSLLFINSELRHSFTNTYIDTEFIKKYDTRNYQLLLTTDNEEAFS